MRRTDSRTDSYTDHQWFWDGQEHVDPAKEANAQATRLASHTTTLAYEFARQGRDWEAGPRSLHGHRPAHVRGEPQRPMVGRLPFGPSHAFSRHRAPCERRGSQTVVVPKPPEQSIQHRVITGGGDDDDVNLSGPDEAAINGGIESISVASWQDGKIRAAWIGSLNAKTGSFNADLDLVGASAVPKKPTPTTLGATSIKGALSGKWTIHGSTGGIIADTVDGDWDAHIDGAISTLTIRRDLTGSLTAASVGAIKIGGSSPQHSLSVHHPRPNRA